MRRKPIKQRRVTITYSLDGVIRFWETSCSEDDDEDTIMAYLHKHIPQATFIKAIIEDK